MSEFKALRDISIKFETFNRQVAAELCTAKLAEPFEQTVNKKLQDVKLFTAKLRLLKAKSLAGSQQTNKVRDGRTILDYEEAVSSKIIEQLVVKAVTQNTTVTNLITMPDEELRPEFVEKKKQILEELKKYGDSESELHFMQGVLDKAEAELLEERKKWDRTVGKLKDIEKEIPTEEVDNGPLVHKLQVFKQKIDQMRWLINKLVTRRADRDYDWENDPQRRIRALAIARQTTGDYE